MFYANYKIKKSRCAIKVVDNCSHKHPFINKKFSLNPDSLYLLFAQDGLMQLS